MLLLVVLAIGFVLGYGVREIFSRRRRAAAREAADEEPREPSAKRTLPRLE